MDHPSFITTYFIDPLSSISLPQLPLVFQLSAFDPPLHSTHGNFNACEYPLGSLLVAEKVCSKESDGKLATASLGILEVPKRSCQKLSPKSGEHGKTAHIASN